MKPAHALTILSRYAEAGAAESERIHLFEALAAVASEMRLANEADAALKVCEQLRAMDRAQLDFREILRIGAQFEGDISGDGGAGS
jgi:hypothetical protein